MALVRYGTIGRADPLDYSARVVSRWLVFASPANGARIFGCPMTDRMVTIASINLE